MNMTLNMYKDETGSTFGMLVNQSSTQRAVRFTKENNALKQSYNCFTSSLNTDAPQLTMELHPDKHIIT